MKRFIATILMLATVLGVGTAALKAADIQPIAYPFIGRWQPSEDPVLIDDYGFQDIQNLRKEGKHLKGIPGHTIINTTSISTAPYIMNGFHFYKDKPQESHVVVLAGNSTTSVTASYLYQNTTAIPSAGNFSATVLHTDTTGGIGTGRFALAPAGNMVYTNGPETLIWGGNEIEATAFITSTASLSGSASALTSPIDYSSWVTNNRSTRTDMLALVGGGIDGDTKMLVHSDGTDASTIFVDAISTARTITASGAAALSTAQKKFGSASMLFTTAATDYITINDNQEWSLTTYGIFDFWFRPSGTTIEDAGFFQKYSAANDRYYFYYKASTQKMYFGYQNADIVAISDTVALNPNQWYHIAVSIRFSGTQLIYGYWVNGVTKGNGTVADATAFSNPADDFQIGKAITKDDGTVGIKGYIDEFRVSSGTPPRWTGGVNFTPQATAYRARAPTFLIGFPRSLQGVKLYIANANTQTSTLTVKEWNGTSWAAVTATDNTSSGGASLAQTGTVTWTHTGDAKPRYIAGYSLYWYQFYLSAGMADIYYTTVDAPMQSIRNIWDGTKYHVSKCLKYTGTAYNDYTDAVNDETSLTTLDLSSLSTAGYFLVASVGPLQGFDLTMSAGSENSTGSTAMTVSYWDATGWTSVVGLNDGTATSTTSLSKSGTVSWQPLLSTEEYQRAIADEVPLYYYKVSFAAAPDSDTHVAEIRGIPAPSPILPYAFATSFQNRLFLFNEYGGDKNKAIYSVENAPDIFNGTDSGYLKFGNNTDLMAASAVYNVFGNSAYDQLIVGKKSEIYRVSGDGPETWVVKRISANIGVAAPLSMVTVEVAEGEADNRRQVVIWQGDKGFYMTDGSAVISISDDIRAYFDPNDSRLIPAARKSKTVAWYDPTIRSYKALISSGSGQATHNIELEYSLITREWTKIYRENTSGADPLQSGFNVFDTSGVGYTYGGNRTGLIYRLEDGTTFAGKAITQYLQTKDLILDTVAPLFRKSTAKYMRLAHKKKTAAAGGGSISVTHYGDQILTVSGSSNQLVPSAFSMATAPYNTQSCALGPFLYHSFKFTTSDTTAAGGMELIGLGLYAEPYTAIR